MDEKSRKKLSVAEQIEHMKNKGIEFNIEDEEFAKEYLANNTYYFKLKAYDKLYDQYKNGINKDKYINLEFAYLRDLATIDSLLRKHILWISIDIEHYLKVKLLKDFADSDEDGYQIIEDFINKNKDYYQNEIKSKCIGKACSNLVNKYKDNFAIWNFVEIISFNDFKDLYSFFYSRNCEKFCKSKSPERKEKFKGDYYYLINPVRLLRNAAAHNNCLLINLSRPYTKEFNSVYSVNKFLSKHGMSRKMVQTHLSNVIIHDFCVMLYLFSQIAPKEAKQKTLQNLWELFDERIAKNKHYYIKNQRLISVYKFTCKAIEIFIKNT